MEPLTALVLIVIAVLISASLFDIMYRELPDAHWMIIGTAGIVCLGISDHSPSGLLMAAGSVLFLIDIRTEGMAHIMLLMTATASFKTAAVIGCDDMSRCVSTPLCVLLSHLLYQSGVLKGGADAKCIISLSIALPVYPEGFSIVRIPPGTGEAILSAFPLSVLLMASILTVSSAIPLMVWNMLYDSGRDVHDILLVRMGIDDARRSHVWPRQDIIDGEIVRVKEADEGALDRLEYIGVKKVLVSPMIPFIVPITVATIFEIIVMYPIVLIS